MSERFRGNVGNSIEIRTDHSDCAFPYEVGHEYLVFARGFQGSLIANKCSGIRPAKMAVAKIRQLRALRDGTALPDLYGFVGTHPVDTSERGREQVQPVPGLSVTARSERGEYRTQTADDGSYEFQGLPAGGYRLSVEPPPGRLALWYPGAPDHIGVRPGNTCPLNFEIYYDGRISGTVVDRDGQPMSGIISALYAGPEKLYAAPVGSYVKNGYFEILRLLPGRYRLLFLAEGRLPMPSFDYPGT